MSDGIVGNGGRRGGGHAVVTVAAVRDGNGEGGGRFMVATGENHYDPNYLHITDEEGKKGGKGKKSREKKKRDCRKDALEGLKSRKKGKKKRKK